MNKKTSFLLAALALIVMIFFVLRRDTGKTLKGDDHDFAFSSTKDIDKIFISNKRTGKYVILKKVDSANWIVNDSFKVNIHQINTLFDGFKRMKVKRPVSKNELFTVKREIAVNGTKVEV